MVAYAFKPSSWRDRRVFEFKPSLVYRTRVTEKTCPPPKKNSVTTTCEKSEKNNW